MVYCIGTPNVSKCCYDVIKTKHATEKFYPKPFHNALHCGKSSVIKLCCTVSNNNPMTITI